MSGGNEKEEEEIIRVRRLDALSLITLLTSDQGDPSQKINQYSHAGVNGRCKVIRESVHHCAILIAPIHRDFINLI